MSALLLSLSILLGVLKSSVYNRYAKASRPGLAGVLLFNVLTYGVAVLVTLCFGLSEFPSPFTLFSALGYGLIVFSLQALSVIAMTIGPMSLTSLLVFYGMIIPSLSGPLFWGERLGALQIVGMVLMITSVFLLYKKDPAQSGVGAKWWILAALCFLLSGGAGVMEKVHQTSEWRDQRIAFLFSAFLFMFCLSAIGLLIVWIAGRRKESQREPVPRALLLGAVAGVIAGFYCQINLYLSGALDSMVYYPIANGGGLLLTVLVSLFVFRERLTRKTLFGIGIGLISILCLSLPL